MSIESADLLRVHAPVPWPVAAMNTVLLLEAIVFLAVLPRLVRFYADLLRGRSPSLSHTVCRRVTAMIAATLVVIGVLAVFVFLDYAEIRAYFLANPALRPKVTAAALTFVLYEYTAAVAVPAMFNFLGLGVWLYAYTYCRHVLRGEPA